jgi:acetyltransferase EpsM
MVDAIAVIIPLLNPNEPEAMLAGLHVQEGQQVAAGDVICTLETTKSAADVQAETSGYIAGLHLVEGQSVRAGDRLCYLAPSPDWTAPPETAPEPEARTATPDGMRITQPALALAQSHAMDLSRLPVGPLITESMLRTLLEKAAGPDFSPPETPFDATAVVIYGGGGHGKSLIDLLRALGTYRVIGVVDDGIPAGIYISGVPVVGGGEVLAEIYDQGVRLAVNAVGGIGSVNVRVRVFRRLAQAGFACPAVAHPKALIEPGAMLSSGVQIFPHAYVGSEARLGYGTIVNTGAIVSHDCQLGDYVNISPGAMLAGAVQVGSGALVGMGATLNLEVNIGAGARIGNGATVKSDVPAGGVVRAGSVWPS